MKFTLGHIESSYAGLPKFMVHLYHRRESMRCWGYVGQLYRGYWGIDGFVFGIHLTIWLHHVR